MRPTMIAAVLLLAASCSKTPGPAAPAAQPAPSILTADGRARLLALMDPGAGLPVDQTIKELQAVVRRAPDKLEAWLALGQAWIVEARETARPARYANAGACAEILLSMQPDNKLALELQGLVLMNDHRFEEARAAMAAVTARWPEDPVAWGTLSDALLDLGRAPEAIAAAQRMMDLKPNLPSYSRAAFLQWLSGDVAAAKESLRLAIDAGGDGKDHEPKAWVLVQAAMVFWNEGDAAGAESGFELALETLPDFPPALVGRARVLMGRGDGKEAAVLLARARRAHPLVETGWLLGDALQLAGDEAGAQASWAETKAHGDSDPRTLALFLATKDREPNEALRLIEGERKVRDDLYTEDALAWVLYRLGPSRLAEAQAASDKAIALGTRDAKLWFHNGAIRIARGDRAGGQALIRRALALNPHFDRSGEAEARRLLAVGLADAR